MSKQLLSALHDLEVAGIIDPETSKRIQDHYAAKNKTGSENRINIVFAILGTILVSLGIILVIAHNWDQLSRGVKIFFAFLPLILGQVLCSYTLVQHKFNRVWLECSSVFLFFAVGACIAMVSQVYHIPSSGGTFVFTWMLLVFPLIYLMRSSITSLLYIVGITAYATFFRDYTSNGNYHYCWMMALAIPYYLMLIKNEPKSNYTFVHHWIIPLSLLTSYGFVFAESSMIIVPGYFCLFAVFYLIGSYADFLPKTILGNGYLVIGSVGTVVMLLICSFGEFWGFRDTHPNLMGKLFGSPSGWSTLFLFIFASFLAFHFIVKQKRLVNWVGLIYLPFMLIFFLMAEVENLPSIFVNILTLIAGLATINRGNRLNHLGILNYGLIIIALLVLCRFFDDHISFVIRGLMFIAVGVGFFVANNRLIRKRKLNEQ